MDSFESWIYNLLIQFGPVDKYLRHLKASDTVTIGDRGLVATKNLQKLQTILKIPTTSPLLVLTPRRALQFLSNCCPGTKVLSLVKKRLSGQEVLSYFFFHAKACTKLRNNWKIYLDYLPLSYSDSCFIYSIIGEEAFKKICNDLHPKLLYKIEEFLAYCEKLYPSFTSLNKETCCSLAWSYSTVNSRCVYCDVGKISHDDASIPAIFNQLENDNKVVSIDISKVLDTSTENIAIVPFFDLFNHDPSVKVDLVIEEECMCLSTDQSLCVDEQVFINYGPHDNATLLAEYGFTLPPPNNFDYVPVYLDDMKRAGFESDQLKCICSALGLHDSSSWEHLVYIAGADCDSLPQPSYYLLLVLFNCQSASFVSHVDETFAKDQVKIQLNQLVMSMKTKFTDKLSIIDSHRRQYIDAPRCVTLFLEGLDSVVKQYLSIIEKVITITE